MPPFRNVLRVIEDNETLNLSTRDIGCSGGQLFPVADAEGDIMPKFGDDARPNFQTRVY